MIGRIWLLVGVLFAGGLAGSLLGLFLELFSPRAKPIMFAGGRPGGGKQADLDERAGIIDVPPVRGLHTHSLTVAHPDTGAIITKEFAPGECGNRCDLHDECELACVLPAGHDDGTRACRCKIAVRTLEQRHLEETTAARQKGPTD